MCVFVCVCVCVFVFVSMCVACMCVNVCACCLRLCVCVISGQHTNGFGPRGVCCFKRFFRCLAEWLLPAAVPFCRSSVCLVVVRLCRTYVALHVGALSGIHGMVVLLYRAFVDLLFLFVYGWCLVFVGNCVVLLFVVCVFFSCCALFVFL